MTNGEKPESTAARRPGPEFLALMIAVTALAVAPANAASDREQAGLLGPVHTVVQRSSLGVEETVVETLTTSYDREGNEVSSEVAHFKVGSPHPMETQRSAYNYDAARSRKEVVSYKAEGAVSGRSVSTFDSRGNLVEFDAYNAEGSLMFRLAHRYDALGREIETVSSAPDGRVVSTLATTYDADGRPAQVLSSKGDGSVEYRLANSYDANGNRIGEALYSESGTLTERRAYRYGPQGHVVQKTWLNADGAITRTEAYGYEFDEVGNWTRKVTSRSTPPAQGGQTEITETTSRTITYYP